jgi:nitrogen fixation NifU-like protein
MKVWKEEIKYMQYSEKVMDHFTNPRNVGIIENADGIGVVGNPQCGDVMKMYLEIDEDIITDAKFKTFGCGAAVATSSMATELIKGRTIEDALKVTNAAVAEALDGLPPIKMHCSILAEECVRAAIDNYMERNGVIVEKCDNNIFGKSCCNICQLEEAE